MSESSQPSLFDDDKFKQEVAASRALSNKRSTHCSECGHELKTERSQHYGIGSECEQKNQYVIDFVDISNGGSWEEIQRGNV